MTNQEKHAVRKIMTNCRDVCVSGPSYSMTDGMVQTSAGDDPKLLDSDDYKKGYKAAVARYDQQLEFLLTASPADLVKFAGRPKK